jgi:citrate synthase
MSVAVAVVHAFQIYVGAGKRDYVPVDGRTAVESHKQMPSAISHSGCVSTCHLGGRDYLTTISFVLFCSVSKRTALASFKGKARL